MVIRCGCTGTSNPSGCDFKNLPYTQATSDHLRHAEVKGCSRGLLELMNWMILFAFIISFVPCCVMCCCAARPEKDDDVRSPRSIGSPRMYSGGGRQAPLYIYNYPRNSAPRTPGSPVAHRSTSPRHGNEARSKVLESKSKELESKSKELKSKGQEPKSKENKSADSPKSSASSGVYFFEKS